MILVLVLAFTGVLVLLAATLSGTTRSRINVGRDEAASLRAEMASEAGLEFAQRQLALDVAWSGTDAGGVVLANGSRFVIDVTSLEEAADGATEAVFTVTGHSGSAVHKFSTQVLVSPSKGGLSTAALLFLGQDFSMSNGVVNGDVLFADRARRVNDWMFDPFGDGYYAASHGPLSDGLKSLSNTQVNGTVFKYRDDLPEYQTTGNEVLLERNTDMPSWDLDEFAVPGPGKVILNNPHNVGNEIWKLAGLRYEETVVINLANKQTVTLTNCDFKGGLVVLCPEDYDVRAGARNLVHIKKGTTIGGGTQGLAPHIGLVAPGGILKNEGDANSLTGFHLVNEIDMLRNATISGQLVILNGCKELSDCTLTYDANVTANMPPWFGRGVGTATTQVLSIYEDFE